MALADDLTIILRTTRHLEQETIPTTPPAGTNAGHAQKQPGPTVPFVPEPFYYLINEVEPILAGWATNLASDLHEPIPRQSGTAWWAEWLAHHLDDIHQSPWREDCEQELHDLAHQLQAKVDPPQTTPPPTRYMTTRQLADHYHVTYDTMKKRLARMNPKPTPYVIGGKHYYRIHPNVPTP